jgi:predicted nucleotidyltransferase
MAQGKLRMWTQSLRRFLDRQEKAREERRVALHTQLEEATRLLVQKFPTITHVAVIGSFLTPALFRTDSDIAVVIRGLRKEDYFAALSFFEQKLQSPVDLLREEEILQGLRTRLTSALVLYADESI